MSVLSPLNQNCVEARSEIPSYISNQAFSGSIISDESNDIAFNSKIPDMLARLIWNRKRIDTTNPIVIIAITCATIAFFPKIVVLIGCIAFSALSYNGCVKLAEKEKCRLLFTILDLKEIEYLSDPDLIKKSLRSLYSCDDSLKQSKLLLECLEKSPLKEELLKKHEEVSVDQKKINQTLMYFKSGLLGSLVEKTQLDLLLEDLTPLINDVDRNSSNLKDIQETLQPLVNFSFKKDCLERDCLDLYSKISANQESLSKKLNALQKNSSFFKENKTLLKKIAGVFLKIKQNSSAKTRACRDFMFYSLTGTSLIKAALFFNKHLIKAKWVDNIFVKAIGNPFTIGCLGLLAIGYAAKNVHTLIAHRNDEAKRRAEEATITEDDRNRLNLLLDQSIADQKPKRISYKYIRSCIYKRRYQK